MNKAADLDHQFDVVIVGAGLVGAALALSLKDEPVQIALLDAQSEIASTLPPNQVSDVNAFEARVSALTIASQQLLRELNVWPYLEEAFVQPYEHMRVWDELGTASIQFDAAELHAPQLGAIVENKHVLAAMHSELKSQANLKCFWGVNVKTLHLSQERTQIQLADGLVLNARLLVGADGANSRIRSLASIPTREWDYEHQAIVCTIETAKPHSNTAYQRFSELGPLAFLPLKDGKDERHFSSIVWSLKPEQAAKMMAVDDPAFIQALDESSEAVLGDVRSVSKRFGFPLRQRHAKKYVQQGVVLLGDAAHTIHPLAGQGVNLGFKDVVALSQVIKSALKDDIPLNHPVYLQRYQRERQGDNLLMMGMMEGFKQLFGNTDPVLRWIRNTGLSWMNKQTLLKNEIVKRAMGLEA